MYFQLFLLGFEFPEMLVLFFSFLSFYITSIGVRSKAYVAQKIDKVNIEFESKTKTKEGMFLHDDIHSM
jgi:hypothetical protein